MNQTEAYARFNSSITAELNGLYEQIQQYSTVGDSSIVYYPVSRPVRDEIKKRLKAAGYWVKETSENRTWSREEIRQHEDRGEFFIFSNSSYRQHESYRRHGLKIWWNKPPFFEYWL